MNRREWERQYFRDLFIALTLSTDAIADKLKGAKRWTLAVTLKGRRVVANHPEVQAELDAAWARLVPTPEKLDAEWERTKRLNGAARALGRAAGRSLNRIAVDVLRGKASA